MLDEQIKYDLEYISQITNESMSAITRRLLADKIKVEKKKYKRLKKINGAQLLLKLAKEAEKIDKKYGYDGPTDLSINHDYYLYGLPKVTK